MKVSVRIKTDKRQVLLSAEKGETLLSLLRRAGIPVTASCGGNGTCGKCRVLLDGREVPACRTAVSGDCEVVLTEAAGGAILGSASVPQEKGHEKTEGECFAAVDLGTTTVALELFSTDGRLLGSACDWNAQAAYGGDVISRCQYCMEHPDGVRVLQGLIRGQVFSLIRSLGAAPAQVARVFLAGNTVMQHLFAGISPAPIAAAPFRPALFFDGDETPEAPFLYAPCVAGYVGGDITAGIWSAGLQRSTENALFLDVGTNGEMALCTPEGILGCAVASGPAFEGVGIRCGMPGLPGAVSHVSLDGDCPVLEVIGGEKPKGICGSGLIDLLAMLLEMRLISGTGLLYGPEDAPFPAGERLGEDENGNGIYYLTEDRSVFLTAADVRQLQLAKAAVAAGIAVLLKEAGLRAEDIDRLYLAGGFGCFMNLESAAAIGMLPACLRDRTVLLGNSSLTGAGKALFAPGAREELLEIRRRFRYLELSGNALFNRLFPEEMMFYEEDEEEWN